MSNQREKLPNVILLMSDQHRADALGCAGNPIVKTPSLDRLARNGVLFTNAYTQCPVCMASRASIHTGRYPGALRVRSMGLLPPTETTLAETLKRAGYRTGMFGKLHFTPQEYTSYTLGIDRPVDDARIFLEPTGILSAATRAAVEDPFKKRYGFDTCIGVEDLLWGNYLDWLAEVSPEHVRHAVAENWGRERDGTKYGSSPPAARMFHPTVGDFFDSHLPAELHPSAFIVDRTLDFARENRGAPFFAHCSFVDPHHPFNAPQPFSRMYAPGDMPVPPKVPETCFPPGLPTGVARAIAKSGAFEPALWQWARANYYGMVSHLDWCVGRLLDGLESLGVLRDTLIVFASDHGEYVGDHRLLYKGSLLFDGVMRIPLILSWPSRLAAGRTVEALVQEIDIYPTVLSLLGLPAQPGVQGRNLAPLMVGEAEKLYEQVFCELDALPDDTYAPSQAIRTREWKMDYFPLSRTGLLFNLLDDPQELRNLFHDPACAGIRHALMSDLVDRLYEAKDPLPIRLGQA